MIVAAKPKPDASPNVYLRMPLDRVKSDALYGVRQAREAWRILDPDGANLALGRIVEPNRASKPRRGTRRRTVRK
jgi:hypothetical protein